MKRFHTNFNGILWKAARATTPEGFNSCIGALRRVSPKAAEYVLSKHPEKWARAFFNGRRFGHLTSNVAESANAFISDLRTLHPTHLFAGFIRKVNALFLKRRSLHATLQPDALPGKPAALVKKAIDECRTLRVIQHSETLFEVQRMSSLNEFRSVDVGTQVQLRVHTREGSPMPAHLRRVHLQSSRPEDPCHPQAPRRSAAGSLRRVHCSGRPHPPRE